MTVQGIDFAATRPSQVKAIDDDPRWEVMTTLICDNSLLRTGIQQILSGTTFAIAEGRTGPNLGLPLEQGQEPALIIIMASQSSMPTLIEMVRLAKESCPAARVVALVDQVNPDLMRVGLEAGVDGICLTGAERQVLIKSLELVMLGESVLPSATICSLLGAAARRLLIEPQDSTGPEAKPVVLRAHNLSTREAEVLTCLMDGEPNKIIARKLDITEATVKVHVKALLRKIGAANRTQAAIWATEHLPSNARASLNA